MVNPFQFQAYQSSAPQTIADLMARRGEIAARGAQASGQARAAAIANIGQGAAGELAKYQQEQKDAPIRALQTQQLQQAVTEGQQKIDAGKRAVMGQQVLAAAVKQFSDNPEQVVKFVTANGFPELAEPYVKAQETLRTLKQGQIKDQESADAVERDVLQGGFTLPPERRPAYWIANLGYMKAHGVNTSGLSPIWDDAQAQEQLAHFHAEKPISVNAGDTLVNPTTLKPIYAAPAKKTYEQKTVTLDGKPNALVNYDPQTGQSFIPGSTEPIDAKRIMGNPAASIQIHNMGAGTPNWPGDWNAGGEDFIKSIPKQWQMTVRKIAHYDEDPTKVASMRGGNREMLMSWVNQVNPAYDASMFTNRAPTRKAYTTGTQGQQITAMNTAVEHLDQLQAAADALANGTFKPGNRAYNYLRDTFGSAMPSNYDTIKNMVDKEVEAVANKGVPTVSGTAAQQALAGTAASPASIKGYIDTLIPLMGSKLNALHYQYQQAMGADDPWKPLTPQAEAILQKRGVTLGPRQESAQTTGVITVSTPSGKAYPFQTQADADRFVADAKAKGLWK